jgi:SNF2 family DNA or RNA helicase
LAVWRQAATHRIQAPGRKAQRRTGAENKVAKNSRLRGRNMRQLPKSEEVFTKVGARPWAPKAHQKRGIKFCVGRAVAGLLLAPGMGKTSTMLGVLKILKSQNMVRRALVIAPLRPCYHVWPAEVQKWTDFNDFKIGVLHGKEKDQILADESTDIQVINPEGLAWLYDKLRSRRGKNWPWEMLVVDESTKFKNTDITRFRLLKPMLGNFQRRYILTGTFAPNGMMDVFGQTYILDQGAALGRYITHFRGNYFYPTGYGGYDWQLRDGAEEEIMQKLAHLMLRMRAEDWIDMPPKTDNLIWVEMPSKVQKDYDKLEKDFFLELEKGKLFAANAAALSMKLRQFAGGAVYTFEGAAETIHTAKLDALKDLIEELQGDPLLVGYEFQHDFDAIQKLLGGDVPSLGNRQKAKVEKSIVNAWNAGKLPVLLANPKSAGHGLNLQGTSRNVCFFNLTWDLELYEQFVDRVYRQDVTGAVIVHHILAKNTIDHAIYRRLQGKDKKQQAIMDALRGYGRSKFTDLTE